MQYLEATTGQVLKIIGRTEMPGVGTITITDQHTNVSTDFSVMSWGTDDYFFTQTLDLSALTNERLYCVDVLDDSEGRIYKGLLFLTDQPVGQYSINNGEYLERTETETYGEYTG